MEQAALETAASDIASHATQGPGPTPGSRVANTLSPHFMQYTRERIRSLLHVEIARVEAKIREEITAFEAELKTEQAKVTSVLVPDTINAEAAQAVHVDAATNALHKLEAFKNQVVAHLRAAII